MEETQQIDIKISLEAQLASLTSALNMHVMRAEQLAAEIEQIKKEIEGVQGGSQQ